MIAESVLFSINLHQMFDGTTWASIMRTNDDGSEYVMEQTGYSSASLCLEEASSLIDAMLFTWLAVNRPTTMDGVTG